jgi:phenylalanyl-tRNA synthetase beta chain
MLNIAENDERYAAVHLLNPLSEDQAVMRTTLLPGLLDNVKRNINYQKSAIKMFEIGKIFQPADTSDLPKEETMLTGVLSGNRHGTSSPLYFKNEPVDIFDVKGAVEFIFRELGLGAIGVKGDLHFALPAEGAKEPFAENGYALDVLFGAVRLGSLGKIKAEVLRRFSIKHDVYYFDLFYDTICAQKTISKKFSPLPVYPSVKRDIALVVSDTVSAGELLAKVQDSREKLVESCEIFDLFTGEKIPEGFKSVALTITYRSENKTLTEKNVEKSHSKIVRLLTDEFGGSFRNA